MCGSGTLLIEAAMIAADIAPGLQRNHYGFIGWKQHDQKLWDALVEDAQQRKVVGLQSIPVIRGYDLDARAVRSAQDNIIAAGLGDHIQVSRSDISDLKVDGSAKNGLLIVNPPYGQRMDADQGLASLYSTLGKTIRRFSSWHCAVFTGNPSLTHRFRQSPDSTTELNNGELACKLFTYRPAIAPKFQEEISSDTSQSGANQAGKEMLVNRLNKNMKSLRGWAKSAGVDCYRIYDADLPEYAAAIDLFPGTDGIMRVHVQEYAAPKTIETALAAQRLQQLVDVLPNILACDRRQIHVKVRTRQRGTEQYEKMARREEFHPVHEQPCQLLVNLADYHDCGLFLDHRKVRQKIHKLAKGKRFLNLFAYTGAASVHAASGGASVVTTIDMSNAYLDWAKKNFALNSLPVNDDDFVRADCLEWLDQVNSNDKYDLILLDPPTFSNSKRMSSTWDVQRDHATMITKTMAHLNDDGLLLFSTNRQRFKLDQSVEAAFSCREISKQTIPRDFNRNARIHRCWEIQFCP